MRPNNPSLGLVQGDAVTVKKAEQYSGKLLKSLGYGLDRDTISNCDNDARSGVVWKVIVGLNLMDACLEAEKEGQDSQCCRLKIVLDDTGRCRAN